MGAGASASRLNLLCSGVGISSLDVGDALTLAMMQGYNGVN